MVAAVKTVAFLYPGAMGASLARTLHIRQPGLRLLTAHTGRSASTAERAASAGLINAPLADVVAQADIIFSILPPSAALELAGQVADLVKSSADTRPVPPVYIDANAVSPGTISEIAGILGPSIPFIDGCVIGLPATDTYEPKIFLSSSPQWKTQLESVTAVLGGEEPGKGLKVVLMEDAGEGAASALKMAYGGMGKGFIGLAALLVLASNAHSPATAKALLDELAISRPAQLFGLTSSLNDMIPKAYRWVGEMEEIGSFISTSLGLDSSTPNPADTYTGIAKVFERVAADLRATGQAVGQAAQGDIGDASEVDALRDFATEARRVLDAKGYKKP